MQEYIQLDSGSRNDRRNRTNVYGAIKEASAHIIWKRWKGMRVGTPNSQAC